MVLMCPCCDKPAVRRTVPLTDHEAARVMLLLLDKGWTRDRLLRLKRRELDYVAPGFIGWMKALPDMSEADPLLRLATFP